MAIKYCIDCGNPFNPTSSGASDIRDSSCNKKLKSFFTDDVLKYKNFKKNLRLPKEFPNEDDAAEYYHQQLTLLLKMANRSLETLLSEKATAQFPSDESELATVIVGYIEEVQGI